MSELMKHADIIRAKYKFEIDNKFDAFAFVKAKFKNDQNKIKTVAKLLYKKITYGS
jgi:hypothetical protein